MWPFLKPAICRVKRDNKSQSKAQDSYYVGPSLDHSRYCMRVLTTHRSILTTRNVTWQHVPSAPLAPPQQLPPIAKEGESTAGEGASEEGASSRGRGRVESLYNEYDLDNMTEVRPPVPPATCETPAAEPRAGAGWGLRKANPRHHQSPPEGPTSIASTAVVAAAAATIAAPEVTAATLMTVGIFPGLWGDLRGTWRFLASSPLQSGRTKSQPRGLTKSASYADALLAYAFRTVEVKRTVDKEAAEIERAHDALLKEHLKRSVSGSRSSRGVVRCWSSARRRRTQTAPSQWRSNTNTS